MWLQNYGSRAAPVFQKVSGDASPFTVVGNGDTMNVQNYAPAFADVTGDGLVDLIVGKANGHLDMWPNMGTKFNPVWGLMDPSVNIRIPAPNSGAEFLNIFRSIEAGSDAMPTFVDIDGDGDLDLFIAACWGVNAKNPAEGSGIMPGNYGACASCPECCEDNVGAGNSAKSGNNAGVGCTKACQENMPIARFYKNMNSGGDDTAAPVYQLQDGRDNPVDHITGTMPTTAFSDNLNGIVYASLSFGDLNGDGLVDLMASFGADVRIYKNIGTTSTARFNAQYQNSWGMPLLMFRTMPEPIFPANTQEPSPNAPDYFRPRAVFVDIDNDGMIYTQTLVQALSVHLICLLLARHIL